MFSVQRYGAGEASGSPGGSGGGSSSNGPGKPDRIALINQRKASLQRQGQSQQQEGSSVGASSSSSAEAGGSRALIVAPVTAVAGGTTITPSAGPAIHPSRLAVSQVLRHADKKAKIAAGGGIKEKTKAKQRYLKTKKERRKKRKAAESSRGKKTQKAPGAGEVRGRDDEEDESDEDDDDDDEEAEDEGEGDEKHGKQKEGAQSVAAPPAAKRQKIDDAGGDEDHGMKDDDSSDADSSSSSSSSSVSSSADSSSESVVEERDSSGQAAAKALETASDVTTLAPKDSARPESESEEAALSRFPAPKRTLQASHKDLAAQGLPPGLADPQRVNPATTKSVKKSDHAELDQISVGMKNRLAKMGITEWFAVQTAVIPLLLSDPQAKSLYPNPHLADLCVSAPTGSGKTLSYAVPLVEILSDRICKRLRALIILPTRELVNQVRDTLVQVSRGTSLSIAALTGQQSFQQEQAALVEKVGAKAKARIPGMIRIGDVVEGDGEDEFKSNVDILVTTPGRLIDHLEHTVGFTMQHLRFLVVDEADRLLGQSFQEWLPRLLDALDPSKDNKVMQGRGANSPAWIRPRLLQSLPTDLERMSVSDHAIPVGVQKLLFSATLTRDPAKILALGLRNASFISVEDDDGPKEQWGAEGVDGSFIDRQETFTLPASLKEHMIITMASEKPLDLLHLLYHPSLQLRQVLCFTKSVENATRLVKLIDSFEAARKTEARRGLVAREYSSDLNITQRGRILKGFKAKEIDLLVCSDVMARGMDLPDVRHVISYDVPVDMAKYVHRVGRTARATKEGDAWTLVEEQEARHFKTMIKRGGRKAHMEKVKIRAEDKEELQEAYDKALSKLEAMYTRG